MKKDIRHCKIIFRTLILLIFSLFISAGLLSCFNAFNDSKEKTELEINTSSVNSNKGKIKIQIVPQKNKINRSVLSDMDINQLKDITLTGILNGNSQTLGNWGSVKDLDNETFELETGEWNLTISASYNGFTFSDSKKVQVSLNSIQTVEFELSSDTTTGGLSLKISFASDKTANHASYKLTKYPSEASVTDGEGRLSIENSDDEKYIELKRDTTNALQGGTYRIVFTFYGDENEIIKLNTYSEIIHIKGGFFSSVTRTINLNEMFTIYYHTDGGEPVTGTSLIEKYSINSDYSSITFPDLSKENYVFLGWFTELSGGTQVSRLPDGSSGDQHFYARWQAYPKLSYKMVNYSYEVYDVSDSLRESYKLPALHNPTQVTDLNVYEITDGTSPITCSFYYNSTCTNQITGGTIPAARITEDSTIYIKPAINHVYIKPDDGIDYTTTDGAGNDQFPFDSRTPAKTVGYAKEWLENIEPSLNPVLYVMSSITSADEVSALSELSLDTTSGQYGAAIVKRYHAFINGYLIDMESGTATVTNVIIDGGADWRDSTNTNQPLAANTNVNEGLNNGISSNAGLIKVNNGATMNMQNVTLRNNECCISANDGKTIEVLSGGVFDIQNCSITRCKADLGGAIFSSGKVIANTITMSYNCALYNGGAVLAAAGSNILFRQSSFLVNTANCGGAVYNMATSNPLILANSTFTDNSAGYYGNILYNVGNMTISGVTTISDGLFSNDFYIDDDTNIPIKIDSDFSITGTSNKIKIYPYTYFSGTSSSPVFDRQIFNFSNLTIALSTTIQGYFELNNDNYVINGSGYIVPKPGAIIVTPGFPGTYSCVYIKPYGGGKKKIRIILKDSEGNEIAKSLIKSLKVTLYVTGDAIKSWTGTYSHNFSEALTFDYPEFLDDPTDKSFYVEVSLCPEAGSYVEYTYDFYATFYEETITSDSLSLINVSGTTWSTITSSTVFKYERNFTFNNLLVSDHETTQAEYEAVMGVNPSNFASEPANGELQKNRPVENVSWFDAIVYCNKRSIAEGLTPCYSIKKYNSSPAQYSTNPDDWGTEPTSASDITYNDWSEVTCDFTASATSGYRLPTEAEWEFLARGGSLTGTQTKYSGTNTNSELGNYAWYVSTTNVNNKTHEVKKKLSNGINLYDMSGNVFEWCWDKYAQTVPAGTPATGPQEGDERVRRGGCYSSTVSNCSVDMRFHASPYTRNYTAGFRVVRSSE